MTVAEQLIGIALKGILLLLQYLLLCEVVPLICRRALSQWAYKKRTDIVFSLFDLIGGGLFFMVTLSQWPELAWKSDWKPIYLWLLALITPVVLFFFIEKLIDPMLEALFVKSSERYRNSIKQLNNTHFRLFIKACILAPILEELMARGVIQGQLMDSFHPFIAILTASIIFAVIHVNLIQIFSDLIPSLVLGLIYYFTGSLVVCMAVHMIYNVLSFWQLKGQLEQKEGRHFY